MSSLEQPMIYLTPEEYAELAPMMYHTVPLDVQQMIEALRIDALKMGLNRLRQPGRGWTAPVALEVLAESLRRSIATLALQHGTPQLPPGFAVDELPSMGTIPGP